MNNNDLENIILEARAEGYEQAENNEPDFLSGENLKEAANASANNAIEEGFITSDQATHYSNGFIAGYNDFIKSIKGN